MKRAKDKIYLMSLLKCLEFFCDKAHGSMGDLEYVSDMLSGATDVVPEGIDTDALISKAQHLALGKMPDAEMDICKGDVPLLKSILQFVGEKKQEKVYTVPPIPLTIENTAFPAVSSEGTVEMYADLWKEFCGEMNAFETHSLKAFTETLLGIMFKYTTNIPCGFVGYEDVSLYDQAKTTASIAICLYENALDTGCEDKPFLLIGGDFSGIQGYIYQIVSAYASKNLKGRSYYIRLLSNVIVRYVLKQLDLSQANIIYNSGGSFYVLAPNTEFVKDQFDKVVTTIENHLFKAHGTAIFVAMDYIEIPYQVMIHGNGNENLGVLWKKLFDKRDAKKQTKFADTILSDYDLLFSPFNLGGDFKHDSITGEELSHEDEKKEKSRSEIVTIKKKSLTLKSSTYLQIKIGEALKSADYIAISEVEIPEWKSATHVCPADLGFYYYFLKSVQIGKLVSSEVLKMYDISLVSLNDFNLDSKIFMASGIGSIHSLEFYGGNVNNENTFEEMCDSEGSFKRLGVLRMDVDNLGNIFQTGINPEIATLSRYAALSRSFDYFFSGYLNTIQQTHAANQSSIIYSGGDDVFIVGSWEKAILLAEEIRKDFAVYTCNNPIFSISGGVSIHSPKFPIMKAAEESDTEEKNAKSHTDGVLEKNSISFMGVPLNWFEEYPKVKKLKDMMVYFQSRPKDRLPKSFSGKVILNALNAKIKDHKPTVFKSYWMLTYDLSRMKSTTKNQEIRDLIDNCIKDCCGNKHLLNGELLQTDYHPLELWAFACRWAELEMRTN